MAPPDVKKFFLCNDKILYKGIYLLSDFGTEEVVAFVNTRLVSTNTEICAKDDLKNTYSAIANASYSGKAAPPGSPILLDENNDLATFKGNNQKLGDKLGSLSFRALYQNDTEGPVTSKSIQEFNVYVSTGIYEEVNLVIIDFTDDNIRTYYLIHREEKR